MNAQGTKIFVVANKNLTQSDKTERMTLSVVVACNPNDGFYDALGFDSENACNLTFKKVLPWLFQLTQCYFSKR